MIFGQFGDSYEPILDGVTNVMKNYAYWLSKKYGKCCVAAPFYPGYQDDESDFEVIRFFSTAFPVRRPYRAGFPMLDYSFYTKTRKIPFDVLHTHSPFTSGIKAFQIARKTGAPIIASFHSKYYDDFTQVFKNENIAKFLTKRVVDFYEAVDAVWVPNDVTKNILIDYGCKRNIDIVQNGTDFDTSPVPAHIADEVADLYGISPEDTVFIFVGQHIRQKNVIMLINSLHELKKSGIGFKMFFIGTGNAENDMKRLAGKLDLDRETRFLGVVNNRSYLKGLYSRADLLLFPSMYDTSGLVIKEAAACGCPTLLIEGSTVSEGITDGYNGFLAENDHESYAAKIRRIIENKAFLQDVGVNARNTIFKSWESIVDEVYQRYMDIKKSLKAFPVKYKPRFFLSK